MVAFFPCLLPPLLVARSWIVHTLLKDKDSIELLANLYCSRRKSRVEEKGSNSGTRRYEFEAHFCNLKPREPL